MPSFKKVLNRMAEVWRTQPDDVAHNAEQMVLALRASAAPARASIGALDDSIFSAPAGALMRTFDPNWGGFGGAPKFPSGAAIAFLLRQQLHADRSLQRDLLAVATVTLDRMAYGGIHDQVGGGFHRYSVDPQWLVPHFEKMLYDNAILGRAYLEAYQATGKDLYRRVAAGIFDYVLRDMTDPRGGFHSAEDADSEGEEGKFYVWRPEEITAVLGEEEGAFFCRCYGVSEEGNFEGRNILHVPRDRAAFLQREGISEAELEDRLALLRRKLLAERDKRVRPAKDDKVLAAWNGMMISALARGYQVLGNERYRAAAEKAADFVLAEMVREGVLLRTYRAAPGSPEGGTSKLPAYLDDYAEMAGALDQAHPFERFHRGDRLDGLELRERRQGVLGLRMGVGRRLGCRRAARRQDRGRGHLEARGGLPPDCSPVQRGWHSRPDVRPQRVLDHQLRRQQLRPRCGDPAGWEDRGRRKLL